MGETIGIHTVPWELSGAGVDFVGPGEQDERCKEENR